MMNDLNLGYFIDKSRLKSSTSYSKLVDFFYSSYESEDSTERLFQKFTAIAASLPQISMDGFNLITYNANLKTLVYLIKKQEVILFDTKYLCSDSFENFIDKCAQELRGSLPSSTRLYMLIYIYMYYLAQTGDGDISASIEKSGILDPTREILPYILAESANAYFSIPKEEIPTLTKSLPDYVLSSLVKNMNTVTKGFFVPQGYRLEIQTTDGSSKNIEAGSYSGSNYSFDDIKNNKNPAWNLVETGETVPDEYNENPYTEAPRALYAPDNSDFVSGYDVSIPSEIHAENLGLVDYPEAIVIQEFRNRLGIKTARDLYQNMLGNHKDINHESVKSIIGIKRDGSLFINMHLKGKYGDTLFDMEREVSEDNSIVTNSSLYIDSEMQGLGIAKAMYDAQENFWRSIGVSSVELHANSDIGGYAWGRLGYDFKYPEQSIGYMQARARRKLNQLLMAGDLEMYEVESITQAVSNCKTASDFCNLKFNSEYTQVAEFGKTLMLGSSWMGVKNL